MPDGYIGGGDDDGGGGYTDDDLRACLWFLFCKLPGPARGKAQVELLNRMEAECERCGVPVPEWLPRLRAQLWN